MQVRSLALLSGIRIQRCRELWHRLQTRLGSRVAVALAIRPLAWEPPYAAGVAQINSKKDKKKKFHANRLDRKAGVAILISDKIDFKTKDIKTKKDTT